MIGLRRPRLSRWTAAAADFTEVRAGYAVSKPDRPIGPVRRAPRDGYNRCYAVALR